MFKRIINKLLCNRRDELGFSVLQVQESNLLFTDYEPVVVIRSTPLLL